MVDNVLTVTVILCLCVMVCQSSRDTSLTLDQSPSALIHDLPSFARHQATLPPGDRLPPRTVLVMLLYKNITRAVGAVESFERVFNKRYHYPYVIFHEGLSATDQRILRSLTKGSKLELIRISLNTSAGYVETVRPYMPGFGSRRSSLGYRKMCRFYAGDLFRQPALKGYDYMFRIDDDSVFICPTQTNFIQSFIEREGIYGWMQFYFEVQPMPSNTLWVESMRYVSILFIFHFVVSIA